MSFTERFKKSPSAVSISDLMARRDQLLALLLTPFFLVAAIGLAKVIHITILEFLPDAVGSIGAVVFLAGTVLVIGTLAATFFWVKTGGFGLFAD